MGTTSPRELAESTPWGIFYCTEKSGSDYQPDPLSPGNNLRLAAFQQADRLFHFRIIRDDVAGGFNGFAGGFAVALTQ